MPHYSSVIVYTVSVKSLVSHHVIVFIIVGSSSPIGRNCLFCCSRFGVCLTDIARISKSFCLALLPITPCRSTVSLELLSVKFGYFSISCLSKDDVAYAIDFICIMLIVVN